MTQPFLCPTAKKLIIVLAVYVKMGIFAQK
jgi:hypothetical protein